MVVVAERCRPALVPQLRRNSLTLQASRAAHNAVTEWVDHHRPTRARHASVRASRRLESSWFGSGAKLKAKAWSLAVEMALGT